jgi:hypothetical protein
MCFGVLLIYSLAATAAPDATFSNLGEEPLAAMN